LELLVAITLLGLLLASLFGGLRLGARVWETGEERLDRTARLQVIQEFLRQRLMRTYPVLDDLESGRPVFEGDSSRLRLVAALPRHLGTGFHEMVLEMVDGEAAPGHDLMLRWRDFEPGVDEQERTEGPFQQRVLVPAIDDLRLAYFGSMGPDEPAQWYSEWRDQADLPWLILIGITFAEEDPRRWPDLIVRPMIDRADTLGF
jgi:general secretion pathway protein J